MSRAEHAADAAAAWIIRREDGDWSEADQAKLDAWLAESDGNKAAYWRLKHSWQEADRIASLGLHAESGRQHRLARFWKPAAIAASLAAVIGVGALHFGGMGVVPQVAAVRYDTPIGGHRVVPLADGSKVELNTRTALRTSVSKEQREVWLDSGEAFFEVAHDPAHPFVVHAGPKTITVLGTKFSIRREGNKVTVSVLQGRVRIDDAVAPRAKSTGSALATSGVVTISEGPSMLVTQRSEERVEDALAWRDGMLSFDQAPLSEVAAEFNRYNRRPIIVTDPEAAGIRIGGTFQASNVDAFVRLLHDAYGLRVTRAPDGVRISS